MKRTRTKEYMGTWRITEMDQWDMDYIDMISPSRIVIDKNGQGEIHFGAVDVEIDCRLEPHGESARLGFSFEGNDECDPVEVDMNKKRISPVHPGVYLKELLDELKLSQYRLARELGVPAMRINHVVNGKRPVTAELALRLGRYFGQSPRYWINLQSRYDMDIAEDALSEQVAREVRPMTAAI
jgi:addiction module HigA family antidote